MSVRITTFLKLWQQLSERQEGLPAPLSRARWPPDPPFAQSDGDRRHWPNAEGEGGARAPLGV